MALAAEQYLDPAVVLERQQSGDVMPAQHRVAPRLCCTCRDALGGPRSPWCARNNCPSPTLGACRDWRARI